jgi:hypothetical protein
MAAMVTISFLWSITTDCCCAVDRHDFINKNMRIAFRKISVF